MFPSPTGVLYLLIHIICTVIFVSIYVSVPYWGSLSSNTTQEAIEILRAEFPSPTGVLYLLIEVVTACQIQNLVSVPYWGSLSSNKNLKSWHTLAEEFPSPTGVLYLLIPPLQIQYLCASIIHFAWQKIFL